MSYARWSNSDWYVFWHAGYGPSKDEQVLACWHVQDRSHPQLTYAELKHVVDAVQLAELLPGAPAEDMPELLEYVREFCEEVDSRNWESP